MCYILFVYFSVVGHLGCFYAPAIVNSATVNIGLYVSFEKTHFGASDTSCLGSLQRRLINRALLSCLDHKQSGN